MKIHRFDGLSFIAGVAVTAIGLAFLLLPDLHDIVEVLTNAGSWFWPAVLIAIGVAVLAPLATRPADGVEPTGEVQETGIED